MMTKVEIFRHLWRHFGPEWIAFRMGYAARLRSGALRRRLPVADWQRQPLEGLLNDPELAEPSRYLEYRRQSAPRFFFSPSDHETYSQYFDIWDDEQSSPLIEAAELARGRLRYFSHTIADIGFPPRWHFDPFNHQSVSPDRHWSQISDFGQGDIKIIWEPSRFGFVYTLVRAYWRTGDDFYAELFWRAVEDWRVQNPPQRGPNWKCGQETSLRLLAWCFGLYALLDAPSTTATRVSSLTQMATVSGARIAANLDYALSQRNNHGISEALGLWTIGLLFPELASAAGWKETGRQALEAQGRDLIYDDGSFSQHSVNYHRLMLHDYLWALRLGDIRGESLSGQLKERVKRAGTFLYQIQDEETGRVPCYGQNDGALILPLNNCDYQDFRAVVQAINYYSTGERCFDPGPWDEDLLWLFGPAALSSPVVKPRRTDMRADHGGYYTLRSNDGFAFIRCATFKDRPAQADMLHCDLWWRGQNIAMDAGTYSYNAPRPWNNALAHTAYHNTVTVDGLDQMESAGKFIWLPWLRSRVRAFEHSRRGSLSYWEGEHDGYERLKSPVRHRRAIVRLADQAWIVIDALDSLGSHAYRLHWLLADTPYEWDVENGRLTGQTPAMTYHLGIGSLKGNVVYSLVRADDHSPRGWRASYYNSREPALSVDCVTSENPATFWTVFSATPFHFTADEKAIRVETQSWRAEMDLRTTGAAGGGALIRSLTLGGSLSDQLEISS